MSRQQNHFDAAMYIFPWSALMIRFLALFLTHGTLDGKNDLLYFLSVTLFAAISDVMYDTI